MPRIFDNIDQKLLTALTQTIEVSTNADFCVGYFNLRGWKSVDEFINRWEGGPNQCCRLLVGMQRLPHEELRTMMGIAKREIEIDNAAASRLKQRLAEEFRDQLMVGSPNNEDEAGLRKLASQLKARKVIVKLFLRHPLHAKLYLLFRPDPISPIVGYLGSSNLTMSGLSYQGELNVDVLDHDSCQKLCRWFEDRWNDRWCIDISDELIQIIEQSWARETLIPPFHIYLKMAYHLSQEARAGLSEFRIPRDFGNKLFDFQSAAVRIAAHHLNKRRGVLIGDVVGLGKTLMATALARIFEDDFGLETLIICPKNLLRMWEDYRDQYRMHAKVLSISSAIRDLADLRRYRLVIIDESHNLRNRETKTYRAIYEYVQENESKCILLSATPYNKTYVDLSNQLRLFVPEDKDLGIRPERLLRDLGETEFIRRHQCGVRTLAAFEKSLYPDDWRDLMRLYLVRRTRTFIKDNYAEADAATGRKYITFADGTKSYFPSRQPRTIKFQISDTDPDDQYARLYADDVVNTVNGLALPRYGLGNYVAAKPHEPPTSAEAKVLSDLSRAGQRLKGFCRTNLFKRLESSGQAFLESIERHVLRNFVYLHAIENNLPLPIGTQDPELLDARFHDEDVDSATTTPRLFDQENNNTAPKELQQSLRNADEFQRRAAEVYEEYQSHHRTRFKWLRASLFVKSLAKDLRGDGDALLRILEKCGMWDPNSDEKLHALVELFTNTHPDQKVLVFTQFADTVNYLVHQLEQQRISRFAGVTGESDDPTLLAWRFSPESNRKGGLITAEEELRILISTDVLSEGQNLQDCSVVVNYDLPWAIIRLIQRVGRVDRIGQTAENILCYSFLPADGVERIIRLRQRVRARLRENAEVVGADESFFEDDRDNQTVVNLYNEKAGILDGEADDESEVDLASYAYQIWKNATTADPSLTKVIPEMPSVVYSTRAHEPQEGKPEGVLVYVRTAEGNDALAWIDRNGTSVTESQFQILKAAECFPNTPPQPRHDKHHELVASGVTLVAEEERTVGGQLGRPSGARFRAYERLKRHAEQIRGTLFESSELLRAIDDIYRYPLRQTAVDTLNRQLRSGISDESLANLVIALRDENRLCQIHGEEELHEPRIICSMGLFKKKEA